MECYKAVRLDRTSHYDHKTKWAVGRIIRPDRIDETEAACGHGVHCSPTLLHAVSYQKGPSLYCVVEPRGILGQDDTKLRCREVKVLRWLDREEQDKLAGFKLWEANHPVNPLLLKASKDRPELLYMLKEWAEAFGSVRESVWASVWTSVATPTWATATTSTWNLAYDPVKASVWASVGNSVREAVWASVPDSVREAVWTSAWDSIWAYIGGLFPGITSWRHAFGPDPWRPLLSLWYAGYVPSFDGRTWRLHAGPKADVVLEWVPTIRKEEK